MKIDKRGKGKGKGVGECVQTIHLYPMGLDWLLGYLILAKQGIKLFVDLPIALLSVWSH